MPRRAASPSTPPHALRRIREARGLSRAELAFRTGFSASHVVKLERGESRLHVDDLAAFAAALDCEPADLVRPDTAVPAATVHAPIVDLTELDEVDAVAARAPHGTLAVTVAAKRTVAVPLLDGSLDRIAPLGSFAVFDRDDRRLRDGEIYLLRYEGRWLCRRWRRTPRGGRLDPDSHERGHHRIAVPTPPAVLGRLVAVIAKL